MDDEPLDFLPRFSGTSDGDFGVTSPRDFDKCPNPQGSQLKSDPPLVRVYATSACGQSGGITGSHRWDSLGFAGIRWDSLLNSMKKIQRHSKKNNVCFDESLEFP